MPKWNSVEIRQQSRKITAQILRLHKIVSPGRQVKKKHNKMGKFPAGDDH